MYNADSMTPKTNRIKIHFIFITVQECGEIYASRCYVFTYLIMDGGSHSSAH